MKSNGYCEKAISLHSDKAFVRNLGTLASRFWPKTKNRFFLWKEEQVSYSEKGELNQYLSLLLTSNHQSPTPAFFTTHNLHLATDPLLFPTPNPLPPATVPRKP